MTPGERMAAKLTKKAVEKWCKINKRIPNQAEFETIQREVVVPQMKELVARRLARKTKH